MTQTTCETQKAHLYGSGNKCMFCGAVKPPIDNSQEAVFDFIKHKRDTSTGDDHEYFKIVYFVLRNRTEENWVPKELTMDEAMSGRMP